jgi:GT2 family glycosyltransferase
MQRTPMPPSCAILVLNYNGQDLLARHLPTVLEAARPDGHRVVVVDNDSRDQSAEVTRDLGAELFPTGGNHFMLGLNQAAKAMDSDVVVTLCNDVSVDLDCFRYLLQPFQYSRVFAVTGQTRWGTTRPCNWRG